MTEDATYRDSGLEDKKVTALIAYLLRMGTDITKPPPGELEQAVASIPELREASGADLD